MMTKETASTHVTVVPFTLCLRPRRNKAMKYHLYYVKEEQVCCPLSDLHISLPESSRHLSQFISPATHLSPHLFARLF